MSAISTILARLRAAIWAIDVRDDIANAIEQCYSDVSNPTLQTEALEAALQNKIDQGEMAALTIGDHTITAAKLANGVIPAADATLTETGKPADAAETGRQIGLLKADLDDVNESLQSLGMTADIKAALLTCINHVAWSDDNGDNYYNALKTALNYIPIAPLYSFDKIGYEIGALSINNISTPADYKLVNNNDNLDTRARMVGLIPAKKGTVLTAKSGYEIVVYQFAAIGFRSSGRYADDTRNPHGNYYCLDSVVQAPAWGTSYIVANDNCNYIRVAFRKTSQDAWTQDEMTNFYGTVFTAELCPKLRYFDVAEYVGGKTFTVGDIVIAGTTDRYVEETALNARAIMRYVPVTKGIFKSADATKYQISVYQISSIGAFIKDTSNPHNDGYPSWADQYTIHLDDVTAVCISFKKLDGTDFTSDELANMYGTVFTYEAR